MTEWSDEASWETGGWAEDPSWQGESWYSEEDWSTGDWPTGVLAAAQQSTSWAPPGLPQQTTQPHQVQQAEVAAATVSTAPTAPASQSGTAPLTPGQVRAMQWSSQGVATSESGQIQALRGPGNGLRRMAICKEVSKMYEKQSVGIAFTDALGDLKEGAEGAACVSRPCCDKEQDEDLLASSMDSSSGCRPDRAGGHGA